MNRTSVVSTTRAFTSIIPWNFVFNKDKDNQKPKKTLWVQERELWPFGESVQVCASYINQRSSQSPSRALLIVWGCYVNLTHLRCVTMKPDEAFLYDLILRIWWALPVLLLAAPIYHLAMWFMSWMVGPALVCLKTKDRRSFSHLTNITYGFVTLTNNIYARLWLLLSHEVSMGPGEMRTTIYLVSCFTN